MTKAKWVVAATIVLLCAETAVSALTPEEKCAKARINAWRIYASCIENMLARIAGGVDFDSETAGVAFAKCRHRYFSKWSRLQGRGFTGSTCTGSRFTDNGDGTVTDNLSGLTWEKKTDDQGVHDKDNRYSWSTGASDKENGPAFTSFLDTVNGGAGSGGANGWRLPTLAELETIVLDFPCPGSCTCPSVPCVDPALDASTTRSERYWSATSHIADPGEAWVVDFSDLQGISFGIVDGLPYTEPKVVSDLPVRAVRGGL